MIQSTRHNPFAQAVAPKAPATPTKSSSAATTDSSSGSSSFLSDLKGALGPSSEAGASSSTPAVSTPAANNAPSLLNLFHGASASSSPQPAVSSPAPAPLPPCPTLESVFGSNPWETAPYGNGPNGVTFSYNPTFFATQQTAQKVAQMIGGSVVQANAMTPCGGALTQNDTNWMVKMPDGRMVNPGLVAACYSHGYPQPFVDNMVADVVNSSQPLLQS